MSIRNIFALTLIAFAIFETIVAIQSFLITTSSYHIHSYHQLVPPGPINSSLKKQNISASIHCIKVSEENPFIILLIKYSPILSISSYAIAALLYVDKYKDIIKDKRLYEYLFKLRGGKSRLKILTLLTSPRTRQDIAKELKMDWKEVDRNLSILMTLNLVTVAYSSPKIKVYTLTDYGKSILSKISEKKLH